MALLLLLLNFSDSLLKTDLQGLGTLLVVQWGHQQFLVLVYPFSNPSGKRTPLSLSPDPHKSQNRACAIREPTLKQVQYSD